jgi:hypothetical protein
MDYTHAAARVLAAIKDERREEVDAYAQHLARYSGHIKVRAEDVTAAILVSDERFLPKHETSE